MINKNYIQDSTNRTRRISPGYSAIRKINEAFSKLPEYWWSTYRKDAFNVELNKLGSLEYLHPVLFEVKKNIEGKKPIENPEYRELETDGVYLMILPYEKTVWSLARKAGDSEYRHVAKVDSLSKMVKFSLYEVLGMDNYELENFAYEINRIIYK